MADNPQHASTWPDPPRYFRRYTAENLQVLARAKRDGVPAIGDVDVATMEPPEIVKEGSYLMFNQEWQV
ncbi:hypothetical protein BC938DRAFT_481124 [Jimgerdemannia flammicorona]|nr:hypothetical protein BC938DRAFT_481124 [Jimgerdemannia flammicorona]